MADIENPIITPAEHPTVQSETLTPEEKRISRNTILMSTAIIIFIFIVIIAVLIGFASEHLATQQDDINFSQMFPNGVIGIYANDKYFQQKYKSFTPNTKITGFKTNNLILKNDRYNQFMPVQIEGGVYIILMNDAITSRIKEIINEKDTQKQLDLLLNKMPTGIFNVVSYNHYGIFGLMALWINDKNYTKAGLFGSSNDLSENPQLYNQVNARVRILPTDKISNFNVTDLTRDIDFNRWDVRSALTNKILQRTYKFNIGNARVVVGETILWGDKAQTNPVVNQIVNATKK